MSKRFFCLTLCPLPFALCLSAEAQQPKKVPRIGYLSTGDAARDSARAQAIRLALRERGHIEGQNIAIEYRHAEGKLDRLPELAAELVRLKVDIIVVTGGDPDIRAAKNATKTIPIIMMGSGTDPVEAGFINSLARAAVLYDPALPSSVLQLNEVLPAAARALGLTIQPWEIRAADGFEKVFAALNKQRPDGLYVLGGALMSLNQKRIVRFALKSRLPSVFVTRQAVDAGGLMYYGADQADSYQRVAYFVDRILKGTKSADLSVEQPTKFELIINLKTAKQIGVTIPPEVLARANKLIK
jgi:putative tryptophan/tyrosine transport system substrate-binding protein